MQRVVTVDRAVDDAADARRPRRGGQGTRRRSGRGARHRDAVSSRSWRRPRSRAWTRAAASVRKPASPSPRRRRARPRAGRGAARAGAPEPARPPARRPRRRPRRAYGARPRCRDPASAVAAARQPPAGDAAAGSGEAAIAIGRCVVAAALARAVSLAGTSGAPFFAVEPAATESGTATDAGGLATSRPAASRSFASVSSRRARRAAQIAMRRATPAATSTSRGSSPASSSTKRARLRTSRATCLVRSQASAKPLAARCASDAAAASWPPFSASSIT